MIQRSLYGLAVAAFMCSVAGCAGRLGPTEVDDVSHAIGPPPEDWTAAIAFYLDDSTHVEFFDGVRTRVVTSAESMESALGRTPWYRLYLRDTLSTTLRAHVVFPGAGATDAEYPMLLQRGAFYGVRIGVSGFSARMNVSAQEPRAYSIPQSVQKTPADSLWIFYGARSRSCWTCPR